MDSSFKGETVTIASANRYVHGEVLEVTDKNVILMVDGMVVHFVRSKIVFVSVGKTHYRYRNGSPAHNT